MKNSRLDSADTYAKRIRSLKVRAFLDGAHPKSVFTDGIKFVYFGEQDVAHLQTLAELLRIFAGIRKMVEERHFIAVSEMLQWQIRSPPLTSQPFASDILNNRSQPGAHH